MMMAAFRPLVVIPVYDHERAIAAMVDGVLATGQDCLLVDDGSGPDCARELDRLVALHVPRVSLLRLPRNGGKGAAVMAGLREAGRRGMTHAVQIDADGQHDPARIPEFVSLARQSPQAVVCGVPIYDASIPKSRLWGRYLTHIWVWINTLSLQIRDSMCGFRVYPLTPVVALLEVQRVGQRMDFDGEILVRLAWRGVEIINVPTPVTYPSDGVSHFDVWWDNLYISRMHARLFFGMLRRLPGRLLRGRWSDQ